MNGERLARAVTAIAAALLLVGAAVPTLDRRPQALVALALLYALWRIGRQGQRLLVPDLEAPAAATAAFALAAGFAHVAAIVLGEAGWMRPAPFLLVVAIVALLTLLARPAPAGEAAPAAEPTATGAVPAPPGWRVRLETACSLTMAAALVGGYVARAIRFFVQPLVGGPDDLSYHLTAVAVWARHADLRMVKFAMGFWGTAFYPILPEISSWVLLTPFGDSDVAARWAELPWLVFSLLALVAVARRLGLRWSSALLACGLYGFIDRIYTLGFAAGNDHSSAFAVLAALDAALAAVQRPRPGRFALLGVCLGLVVASKYTGVYYTATLLLVMALAMAVEWRGGAERLPARGLLAAAVLVAACAALVGGYTYLRNLVATGNPLYPQPLVIAGWRVLAGAPGSSLADLHDVFGPIDYRQLLLTPATLADYARFTLLPAALLAPLVAASRRRWVLAAVLALPVVFFAEFVAFTFDHREIRYFLAAIALAAVAFAWLTERLGVAGELLRSALLFLLTFRFLAWIELPFHHERLLAAGLVALLAWSWRRALTTHEVALARRVALATAALGGLVLALAAGSRVDSYQRVKLARSPAAMALERDVPAGTTVAYVGLNQPYLFFGSRLQNDVRLVPRAANLQAEFFRWGGIVDSPFPPGRYWRWRTSLGRLAVTHVVVFRSPAEDPERRWMVNHPADFSRLHEDGQLEVWRVTGSGRG